MLGKDSRRTQRFESVIRGELARIVTEEVADPRLSGVLITDVRLSTDRKHARIYFTAPAQTTEKQEREAMKGLKHALPFFRRRIADNLEMRYIPELEFERDRHGESVSRLLTVFEEIEGKRPPATEEGTSE